MRAGRLNRKVVVQQKTATTDAYGGPVETWETVYVLWASVQPLKGRELIASQAAHSEVTTSFYTRYAAGIVPSMRIVYGGNVFDIFSVIDTNEAHRELQIMAKQMPSEDAQIVQDGNGAVIDLEPAVLDGGTF
jgi:SPP1 family predicted phage head-tail adaptor